MEKTVLCYLIKDDSYLMIKKRNKNGDNNSGKYLGVGGHIEDGETIYDAARREIKEETNLDVLELNYRGLVKFIDDDFIEDMYLFTSNKFIGEIKESDEGSLHFIKINEIYNYNIWPGDRIFLEKLKTDELINIKLIYKNSEFIGWEEL